MKCSDNSFISHSEVERIMGTYKELEK